MLSRDKVLYPKKYDIFAIALFIAAVLSVVALIFGTKPLFIDNDSYQYWDIAKNIYQNSGLIHISKNISDIGFDQISWSGYDLSNSKPYHFPTYSIFLAGFFYISDNEFFIIFASQFILLVAFFFFSHLILQNYITRKKSLIICAAVFIISPLIIYVFDSGKEIFCPAFAAICFYLGLYSKNRDKIWVLISYSIAMTILVLTRNFYILISVFCLFYRLLPIRFTEYEEKEKPSSLLFFLILGLLLPSLIYCYCYHHLNLHYYDNFRLGRIYLEVKITLSEIIGRGIKNLKVMYVNYLLFLPYCNLFLLSLFSVFLYFRDEVLKQIFSLKFLRVSRLFIIFLFYGIMVIAISMLYHIGGYRMLAGFMPFAFLILSKKMSLKMENGRFFWSNNLWITSFLMPLVVVTLLNNFLFMKKYRAINDDLEQRTSEAVNLVKKYDTNIFVMKYRYAADHAMLFRHKMPDNFYQVVFWHDQYFCDELNDYSNHGIVFKVIGVDSRDINLSCSFLKENYSLIKQDEKRSIYVYKK